MGNSQGGSLSPSVQTELKNLHNLLDRIAYFIPDGEVLKLLGLNSLLTATAQQLDRYQSDVAYYKTESEKLRTQYHAAMERLNEPVSDLLDEDEGMPFVRGSLNLPKYVQDLEEQVRRGGKG